MQTFPIPPAKSNICTPGRRHLSEVDDSPAMSAGLAVEELAGQAPWFPFFSRLGARKLSLAEITLGDDKGQRQAGRERARELPMCDGSLKMTGDKPGPVSLSPA